MVKVHCSKCGQEIELPSGTRSGDIMACPNWPGFRSG
jgi:DNA-directed RNA polymerase subunit RPC12/RpoP